jgi:hypothetical protein
VMKSLKNLLFAWRIDANLSSRDCFRPG